MIDQKHPSLGLRSVRTFQSNHVNYFGKPLDRDGVIGPETQWALDLATLPDWRQSVIRDALREVGVAEERGSNRGVRVELFLRYAGARPGDPWCAAALSYVLMARVKPCASALRLVRSMHPVIGSPLPGDCWCYPTPAPM